MRRATPGYYVGQSRSVEERVKLYCSLIMVHSGSVQLYENCFGGPVAAMHAWWTTLGHMLLVRMNNGAKVLRTPRPCTSKARSFMINPKQDVFASCMHKVSHEKNSRKAHCVVELRVDEPHIVAACGVMAHHKVVSATGHVLRADRYIMTAS